MVVEVFSSWLPEESFLSLGESLTILITYNMQYWHQWVRMCCHLLGLGLGSVAIY